MKTLLLIISFFVVLLCNAQEKEYFILYKGGKQYVKQKHYILINQDKDIITENNQNLFFHQEGERFVFRKDRYYADTCSTKFLNDITIDRACSLALKEFDFYLTKVREEKLDEKIFRFISETRLHMYFDIYIIQYIEKDKIVLFDVDWEK